MTARAYYIRIERDNTRPNYWHTYVSYNGQWNELGTAIYQSWRVGKYPEIESEILGGCHRKDFDPGTSYFGFGSSPLANRIKDNDHHWSWWSEASWGLTPNGPTNQITNGSCVQNHNATCYTTTWTGKWYYFNVHKP